MAGLGCTSTMARRCASTAFSRRAPTTGRILGPPNYYSTTQRLHKSQDRRVAVRAGTDRGPGSFGNDASSDLVFVGKLVAISFGGAIAIKYGSLLLDIPFQPNGFLAMLLVLGPPAAYGAFLWATSNAQK